MDESTVAYRRNRETGTNDHSDKDLLRFITCGSVDDGKSTLIGRLLYETQLVYEDTLEQLEADSKRFGTQGDSIDFALLVDGLSAEREQGITIDVAYRYFSTKRRMFIVADTPGHEQYTRNMVTGASTADLALILLDATKGVLTQTRRHSYIVRLLGIKRVVLVVNKFDLTDYSEEVFESIKDSYQTFAEEIGLEEVQYIPVSALLGENLVQRSERTPWYGGPSLLEYLETVEVTNESADLPFRMPVQWVNRPSSDFRGFSGSIVAGRVRPGDRVSVQPSGRGATVKRIVTADGDLPEGISGQAVTITFDEELDVSRGDVLAAESEPLLVTDRIQAQLVWMSENEMLPGRPYLMKLGSKTVTISFEPPRYVTNINTLEHLAARTLTLNSIGVCHIAVESPIAFDPYSVCRDTGGFIVIDRLTFETVAAGMIEFGLRRADNIHWQQFEVSNASRSQLMGHGSGVVWMTGLSGAGKSTIANLLERKLYSQGVHTYILDGDNVRHGLNKDLGFTDADRVENIRRVAEVARLMSDAGLVVVVSFISPFQAERNMARSLLPEGKFVEVYVDVPLEVAESRDPKGLYKKARAGQLPHFTGIDSRYEVPENPEVRLDTTRMDPAAAVEQLAEALASLGII